MKTAVVFIGLMVVMVNAGILEDLPKFIQQCMEKKEATEASLRGIGTMKDLTSPDAIRTLMCIMKLAEVIKDDKIVVDTLVTDLIESHKFDDKTAEALRTFVADCVKKAEQESSMPDKVASLAQCLRALFGKH